MLVRQSDHLGRPGSIQAVILSLALVIVVLLILMADRSNVLDQENYIRYFQDEHLMDVFFARLDPRDPWLKTVLLFTSEEFLWLVYVTVIGSLFAPEFSVALTVFLLNFSVLYGLSKLPNGVYGMVLWFAIPVGAAVIGYYQIRQGVAFGLFMVLLATGRPLLLSALLAAVVHTTFAIPLAIACLMYIPALRVRPWLCLVAISTVFLTITIVGGQLLGEFGGRRSETAEFDQGATSLNFVYVTLMLGAPSLALVACRQFSPRSPVFIASMVHLGVVIWLTLSFFFLPVGTSRVGYFGPLLSILPLSMAGGFLLRRYPIVILIHSIGAAILVYGGVRDQLYAQPFL